MTETLVGTRPKIFIDTNVCINAANEIIPRDEWQKVNRYIEARYSYQISFVTLKELFAKISRGKDEYFEENKKPLRILCEFSQKEFLPYPAVFALRTVLGLGSVARRSPIPEEELYETVCKAIFEASSKTQLKKGMPYPDKPGGLFSFDLDHFDQHENAPQMGHLAQLKGMRGGRVKMPCPMELTTYLMEDCHQAPDPESCQKITQALDAAYKFLYASCKLSENKTANLEKRKADWGDSMQLYYLCDESMHFLTFDEKCLNQTQGSTQQGRIMLYKDFAHSL